MVLSVLYEYDVGQGVRSMVASSGAQCFPYEGELLARASLYIRLLNVSEEIGMN